MMMELLNINESDIKVSDKTIHVHDDRVFNEIRIGQYNGLQVLCKRIVSNNSNNTNDNDNTNDNIKTKSVKFASDELNILLK